MNVEQRREERLIAQDISKGEVFHPNSGAYMIVDKVRDISSMGAGVQVRQFLKRGEKIRFAFKRGRVPLTLFGFVAWCVPVDAEDDGLESYRMGIQFKA